MTTNSTDFGCGLMACLLGMAAATGGCETREVLDRWTEQKSSRTDERTRLGPPTLKTPSLLVDSAGPHVIVVLRRFLSYRTLHRQQDVEAVRHGYRAPLLTASRAEPATQERCLARLKAGASLVLDPTDWRGTYEREVRNVRTSTSEGQQELVPVPAQGIEVRLTADGRRVVSGETDPQGRAALTLASTLPEALRLKPCVLIAQAQWSGAWVDLGKVRLGEEEIDKVVRWAQVRSMAIRGPVRGIPFARVQFIALPDPIAPGEACDLRLTVRNIGQGAFCGLVATTSSATALFDGVRFRFGKIPPGEELTLRQPVRVPTSASGAGRIAIRIDWSEYNDQKPDPVPREIVVSHRRETGTGKRPVTVGN